AEPETTFAPGQRINDVGREPIRRDGTDLAIAQPEEASAHGREPGAPFQVDVNRAATLRGQAFRAPVRGEARVAQPLEPARRADPQAALPVLEQGRHRQGGPPPAPLPPGGPPPPHAPR